MVNRTKFETINIDDFNHDPINQEKVQSYPPELVGRFNSFIVTAFDDSMTVEMQIRTLIKWIKENIDVTTNALDNMESFKQDAMAFQNHVKDTLVNLINNFTDAFDDNLKFETLEILNKWFEDGVLSDLVRDAINEEVFNARGGKATLGERLNETDTQLAKKADLDSYYYPTVDIKNVDGTGEIDARNITYSEVIQLFDGLTSMSPQYVSKKNLGTDTSGNYSVYAYDFNFNPDSDWIVIDGNIHGDGNSGDPKDVVIALYYFLKDLVENHNKNDKLNRLKSQINISIIPVANPWGFDNNTRFNFNGIDINRNFDIFFQPSETSGEHPFSEKETQIIRDNLIHNQGRFYNSPQRVIAYIPFHSYGESGSMAPLFPFSVAESSPLKEVFTNVAKNLCLKYGYPINFQEVATTPKASSADNYAERVLGIPSGTPEFVVYRNDGKQRTAFAMTQHVEYFGNLIYQTLYLKTPSKKKLSIFEGVERTNLPPKETTVIGNLKASTRGENFFVQNSEGQIVIPKNVNYVKITAQVTLFVERPVSEFPIGIYLNVDNKLNYSGAAFKEEMVKLGSGGTFGTRQHLYSVHLETPPIFVNAGQTISLSVYSGNDGIIEICSPNPKHTWIAIEEYDRYTR